MQQSRLRAILAVLALLLVALAFAATGTRAVGKYSGSSSFRADPPSADVHFGW
jgi:hypothetical protein